jgi:hypothetical protein
VAQAAEQRESQFEPAGQHREMAERLTRRWAEAEALARTRLAQVLARREVRAEERPE